MISLEYKGAKSIIDDIILSFNRDLQKQNEKIQEIERRYNLISVESRKLNEIETAVNEIRVKIKELTDYKNTFSVNYENLRNKINELIAKYAEISKKISEVERISMKRTRERTKVSGGSPPSIIMRDVALSSLTETELKVLRILAKEGEKTVSEIRSKINLTREHTARLMKSLYMRGYVDRKDDKIPYIYSLNKEMENILKREEAQK